MDTPYTVPMHVERATGYGVVLQNQHPMSLSLVTYIVHVVAQQNNLILQIPRNRSASPRAPSCNI